MLRDYQQNLQTAQSAIKTISDYTVSMLKQQYADQKEALQDQLSRLTDRYNKEKEQISETTKSKKKANDDAIKSEKALYDEQKKRFDAEKKAIKDTVDAYKERIKLQIDALKKQQEEDDYAKSLGEKQKSVSDVESQLLAIQFDTSEQANKRRRELNEQLTKAQLELEEFQNKHSLDMKIETLKNELENFTAAQDAKLAQIEAENEAWVNNHNARVEALQAENELLTENHEAELERIEENYNRRKASIERQIKDINDYTSKEVNLRNEATALIEGRSKEFHDNLMQWMSEYTTLTDYEMDRVWKNAYSVLDAYNGKQINVRDTLNTLVAQMGSFEDSISSAASAMERLAEASKQVKSVSTSSNGYGTYTGAGSGMWQAEVRHNGGVVGETTPKTVNLNTPKKPNEIDVRAEKGEVILSNKKSASDVQNALDYLEDALPANDTRAMLAAFVNDATDLQSLIHSPTSINSSALANSLLSKNISASPTVANLERIDNIGDVKFETNLHVAGNLDKSVLPEVKQMIKSSQDETIKKMYDGMMKHRKQYGAPINYAKR